MHLRCKKITVQISPSVLAKLEVVPGLGACGRNGLLAVTSPSGHVLSLCLSFPAGTLKVIMITGKLRLKVYKPELCFCLGGDCV